MPNDNQENENYSIARNISHRYQFYFIALVFTVLAFSIQTAGMVDKYGQAWFEISSWVLLMISGIAGLSRLKWMPIAFKYHGALQEEEQTLSAVKQGTLVVDKHDEEWSDEAKNELEKNILKRKNILEDLERSMSRKYTIHEAAFIVGMMSLIVSRAILHLCRIGSI